MGVSEPHLQDVLAVVHGAQREVELAGRLRRQPQGVAHRLDGLAVAERHAGNSAATLAHEFAHAVDVRPHVAEVVVREGQHDRLAVAGLAEGLAHVALGEQPVARADVEAAGDPAAARRPAPGSRRAPGGRAPTSAGARRQSPSRPPSRPGLRRVLVGRQHRLAREVERDELLQEPVAVRADHVESRTIAPRGTTAGRSPGARGSGGGCRRTAHQCVAQRWASWLNECGW